MEAIVLSTKKYNGDHCCQKTLEYLSNFTLVVQQIHITMLANFLHVVCECIVMFHVVMSPPPRCMESSGGPVHSTQGG